MTTEALTPEKRPPTICRCGSAKMYHRPQDKQDHEYEPRYDPMVWREGYRAALLAIARREKRLTAVLERLLDRYTMRPLLYREKYNLPCRQSIDEELDDEDRDRRQVIEAARAAITPEEGSGMTRKEPRTVEDALRREYPIGVSGTERSAFTKGWQARGLDLIREAEASRPPVSGDALRKLADAAEAITQYVRVGTGPLGDDPAANAMRRLLDALPKARALAATPPERSGLNVERLAERLMEGQRRQGGRVPVDSIEDARVYAAWLMTGPPASGDAGCAYSCGVLQYIHDDEGLGHPFTAATPPRKEPRTHKWSDIRRPTPADEPMAADEVERKR